MKNLLITGFVALLFLPVKMFAQTTPQVPLNFGTWETFTTFNNKSLSPELMGRLCNVQWKQIEIEHGVYSWSALDTVLYRTANDSLPLIFMVYTKEDSPDWLYTTGGVPKVIERNEKGDSIGFSPYYQNMNYRNYFKEMVIRVQAHVDSLPWNVRQWIIGVQPCFGSTGDYISYKGIVDPQYELTSQEFFSLFKEFTLDYYNQYKNTVPKITMLSNPLNQGENQSNWLEENCPGGWIKTGSLGKAYQLNDELDKSMWLLDFLNVPRNGEYIRARSEIGGDGLTSGWWNACVYKNVFAVLANCIFWGVDWSNQNYDMIDDPNLDPAYFFFNRYAGQKDPATSTNAMCFLKDALDAADTDRFPENNFGKAKRKGNNRYLSILDSFTEYGAKLDDIHSATKNEMGNRMAKGINDVGWRIFPGNYDRYLHQLTPNETSSGYWNIQSNDSATTIYGRFGRGFDLAKNKDGLYFMLDTAFKRNVSINAQYPVTLDIVYLDKGNGAWKLFYDAVDSSDKEALQIQCTNSGNWKTASVTLYDAFFGQRASRQSDFYIKNDSDENVIFELIEFARPDSIQSNIGIHTTPLAAFDTVCINSNTIKTFTVSGDFMNNKSVQIGPATGYQFSFSDSAFEDSLIISDYGNRFSKQIHVKLNTSDTGTFTASLPITTVAQDSILVDVSGTVMNSFVDVQADLFNVSCYNSKNGAINLLIDDSMNEYTYSWSEPVLKFSSTNKNIDGLVPGNYHLDLRSKGGCISTADYQITQPDPLAMNITADSMICKNGLANVTVNASGGTMPYIGTGVIPSSSGNKNFTVIDSNGCTINRTIKITNGTMLVPGKPSNIFSEVADSTGLCEGGNFNFSVGTVEGATNYVWTLPNNCNIVSASADSSSIVMYAPADFSKGVINVTAENVCGINKKSLAKNISAIPVAPSQINGPVSVLPSQQNITYSVSAIAGLTYTWSFPAQVNIISGQGTSTVNVNWGVVSGKVNVTAQNACGQSDITGLTVTPMGNVFSLSNTSLPDFDTTCVDGLSNSKSFSVSASNILGAPVIIGPIAGYKFSAFLTGTFTDSIVFVDYGNNLNKTVYVKFSPVHENTNAAMIPISSEQFQTAFIAVSGEGIKSSPTISALVTPVNCFGDKNGTINVQTDGGTGPFNYSWKSSAPPFTSNESYITNLKPADYTVTINSFGGCNASATFTVSQPDVFKTSITADNMYCKNSTTYVYVNGTGGNLPYEGTGTFVKGPGSNLYTITDANGCVAQQYFNVVNGSMVAPVRPTFTNTGVDDKGICYPQVATLSVDPVMNATYYSWSLPNDFNFVNANADSSQISILPPVGFVSGSISVIAGNTCGTSMSSSKILNAAPSKPVSISGLSAVINSQSGLDYSTEYVESVNYLWTVPAQSVIVSGNNTNQIKVNWGTKPGNVSVKKSNACAQSTGTVLYVNILPGFQNSFSNTASSTAQAKDISNDKKSLSLMIYPNPVTDYATVRFYANAAKPYTIRITGIDGNTSQQIKGISVIGKNEVKLRLDQLANGLYQLIYYNEKGEQSSIKFAKEK